MLLNDYRFVVSGNEYTAPECRRFHLQGTAEDGRRLTTSPIERVEGEVVTTVAGSTYTLGARAEGYETFKQMRNRYAGVPLEEEVVHDDIRKELEAADMPHRCMPGGRHVKLTLPSGETLSIAAGETAYSHPRAGRDSILAYSEVEVAIMGQDKEFVPPTEENLERLGLMSLVQHENPGDDVMPWVPLLDVIRALADARRRARTEKR